MQTRQWDPVGSRNIRAKQVVRQEHCHSTDLRILEKIRMDTNTPKRPFAGGKQQEDEKFYRYLLRDKKNKNLHACDAV